MDTTEKKPTRLRDLAEKGGFDVLTFDPRKIIVEPGHNPRRFDTPEMQERIEAIALSIKTYGFWQHAALLLRFDAGRAYLVDGETRLRAVMRAMEMGAEITKIPVISVKGNNEKQRLLIALAANTGRQLDQVEAGSAFTRLVRFGMTPQEIAATLGHSVKYVTTALELFDAPQVVQTLVQTKAVTPARAVSEVRKHGTAAAETLAREVEQKKATGTAGPVRRERIAAKVSPVLPVSSVMSAGTELYESLKEIVADWGYPNIPKWHRAKAAIQRWEGRA